MQEAIGIRFWLRLGITYPLWELSIKRDLLECSIYGYGVTGGKTEEQNGRVQQEVLARRRIIKTLRSG